MTGQSDSPWHVLDISSVPVEEFASALRSLAPTLGWQHQTSSYAALHSSIRFETQPDPPLDIAYFSLQRGFSNPLLRWTFRLAESLAANLTAHTRHPSLSPLVCTSPFYVPVAELWPGPVIYYSTDLTIAYDGLKARQVLAFDRRLCAIASLVRPNSERIGEYLIARADCDPKKLACLPNAARAAACWNASPRRLRICRRISPIFHVP